MINTSLLRALSRTSPKMLLYHVKRALRNRLCPRFPKLYERYVNTKVANVPHLAIESRADQELARWVARFYLEEYRPNAGAVSRGVISLFGQEVDFGSVEDINWHHEVPVESVFHLWRQKLAHMGFLCPMLADGEAEQHAAAERLIAAYSANALFALRGCFSSYWFPYSVSHRILAVLSGLIVGQSEGTVPETTRQLAEHFLRWNIGFLQCNIEYELNNNHLERNLAALCFYYTHARTVSAAVRQRLDRDVRDVIHDTILDDGMMSERSAMYQGFSVMALRIFAATPFLSRETQALARLRLEKASQAWAVMTHPDGHIALYNDSWLHELPGAREMIGATTMPRLTALEKAGYVRMDYHPMFALFDAGAIGPSWNPGHGHADFLSVELDVDRKRFIVDPGTFQYSTGERRQYERSALSHNGPAWLGVEPVDYNGCFKVGRLAAATLTQVQGNAEGAQIAGALTTKVGRVERCIHADREVFAFKDVWTTTHHAPLVRLLIPDDWQLIAKSATALSFRQGDTEVHLESSDALSISVETGVWACEYLHSKDAHAIIIQPRTLKNGAELNWAVRKRG